MIKTAPQPRLSALQRAERERAAAAGEFVRTAVSFAAHFRVGPFEHYNLDADTLEGARTHADALNKEHGKFGRRAVVYAILPGGAREPIPALYSPAA